MENEEAKRVRTYCVKFAQATARPPIIKIPADEMCEIEPFSRIEFKRDGEIVGSFNTKIAGWWIEQEPEVPNIRVCFTSPTGEPDNDSTEMSP